MSHLNSCYVGLHHLTALLCQWTPMGKYGLYTSINWSHMGFIEARWQDRHLVSKQPVSTSSVGLLVVNRRLRFDVCLLRLYIKSRYKAVF